MGMFIESLLRIARDWWQAMVRPFKGLPEPPKATKAERAEWQAIEEATRHEEEVAEEERLARNAVERAEANRTRPMRAEEIHGWTESAFDAWWASLSTKQKEFHHMEPVNFPEGVRLSGDNWTYWNTRALDRSRRFNYRDTGPTPTRNGMGRDGRQR